MNLAQLREATRSEHEATEAGMPLMSPELSLETYRGVLRRLFPVVASWERWAAEHAPASVEPLLAARQRSPLLARDLAFLEAAKPQRAGREDLPGRERAPVDWDAVVNGDAEPASAGASARFEAGFLGALYVMEGSTLGGRFIARHVEESLGLEPGQGDAYFAGHGEATGRMWREVTAQLTAVPEDAAAAVIAAAQRTFQAFGRALQEVAAVAIAAPDAETTVGPRTPVA